MMSKKDYERAAEIAQRYVQGMEFPRTANVVEAFIELFEGDNPAFDEERFRSACSPGANVRAKG